MQQRNASTGRASRREPDVKAPIADCSTSGLRLDARQSIGLLGQTACLWEVTARKVGDVNPMYHFDTVPYADFVLSAAAIAPVLETASHRRIGETVREAVRAMRRSRGRQSASGHDPSPGAAGCRRRSGMRLRELDVADSRAVYEAIRLAQPSGLGTVPQQDVTGEPTLPLREVMALAADRDLVARQYANGFARSVRPRRSGPETGDRTDRLPRRRHSLLPARLAGEPSR